MKITHFVAAWTFLAGVALNPLGLARASSIGYFTDYSDDFGTINLDTGAYQIRGVLPNNVGGIGWGPAGTLYGLDWTDSLVRINPATAQVTTVGPSGLQPPAGTPPDSSTIPFTTTADGRLYGVDTANDLYSFNPVTGQATRIGSTGIASAGLKLFKCPRGSWQLTFLHLPSVRCEWTAPWTSQRLSD